MRIPLFPSLRLPVAAFAASLAVLPAARSGVDAGAQRFTRLDDAPTPGFVVVAPSPARAGETLFFPAWDPKNSDGMRASDGSSQRAGFLGGGRAQAAVPLGGRAYFIGSDATSSRLWTSDGTPGGTTPVAELGGPSAGSLTSLAGALFLIGG